MKYVKLAQMPPMDPMAGMGMPAAPMAMPAPADPASAQKQITVPLANLGLILADAEIEKRLLEQLEDNEQGIANDVWLQYGGEEDGGVDLEKRGKRSDEEATEEEDDKSTQPIIPSHNVICSKSWITIRSEMNYKYLWMHGSEDMWMGASATIDTPIHRKSFILHPVSSDCLKDGGFVLLQEGDSDHFIRMVSPNRTDSYLHDSWVIRLDTNDTDIALQDTSYHFLLEKEGYILNKGTMGFLNVDAVTDYPVRGYSYWDHTKPAKRDYGAFCIPITK
jgi:hypothetical protein